MHNELEPMGEPEEDSPVESGEARRARRIAIALIVVFIISVVSYFAWCLISLLTLGNTEEGAVAVIHRFIGLPAWLSVSVVIVAMLVKAIRDAESVVQRLIAALFMAAAAGIFYLFAGTMVLDVPYLLDPVRVSLHDVTTRVYDGESDVYYYLEGVDGTGKEWEFRINGDTYNEWNGDRTTATVTGLPNTQVTLSIE